MARKTKPVQTIQPGDSMNFPFTVVETRHTADAVVLLLVDGAGTSYVVSRPYDAIVVDVDEKPVVDPRQPAPLPDPSGPSGPSGPPGGLAPVPNTPTPGLGKPAGAT